MIFRPNLDGNLRQRRQCSVLIATVLCFFVSSLTSVQAQTLATECATTVACDDANKPLWEVGVAGIGVNGPDYPGSDEKTTNQLVVPYFIYRGEVVKAGEDGLIKAKAFEDERFELDLSLDAAFSADSDDNKARQGMDDLDFLFGIGPQLTMQLDDNQQDAMKWEVRFQLRSVFSTDFSEINQRGYVFETQLRYEHADLFYPNVKFVAAAGPTWGTRKTMAYFYQVDPIDARPDRPVYEARGGYLGSELTLGVAMEVLDKKGRIFFGTRAHFLQGARNNDSPLFRDDLTYSFALGFAYQLYQSDTRTGSN